MSGLGTESMSRLTPHLVRLHETERLYQLARARTPEAQQELSTAITGLFDQTELSLREQEIVADILITMMRQAERDLRQAISDRLASLENAPLRVILYLSNDEIDVARPVLTNSPLLEEMDLLYLVRTRTSEYWQAIAGRKDLKPTVIKALADTRDNPTAGVLLTNKEITIPQDAFTVLADMAKTAEDLRAPLLQRTDIPKDLSAALYAWAGRKIERDLENKFGAVQQPVAQAVADVTVEMVDAARGNHRPTKVMIDAAKALQGRGMLSPETLLRALKTGQLASFVAQASVYGKMDIDAVEATLKESSGERLAAFCRVARIDKKVFLQMYLMTQRYRNGDRMVDPQGLNHVLSKFDQMSIDQCQKLLKSKPA